MMAILNCSHGLANRTIDNVFQVRSHAESQSDVDGFRMSVSGDSEPRDGEHGDVPHPRMMLDRAAKQMPYGIAVFAFLASSLICTIESKIPTNFVGPWTT